MTPPSAHKWKRKSHALSSPLTRNCWTFAPLFLATDFRSLLSLEGNKCPQAWPTVCYTLAPQVSLHFMSPPSAAEQSATSLELIYRAHTGGTTTGICLYINCTAMSQGLLSQNDLSLKIQVFEGETSLLENSYKKKKALQLSRCASLISSYNCPSYNTFLFLLHLSGYCFTTMSVTAAFDRCCCNLLAVKSH